MTMATVFFHRPACLLFSALLLILCGGCSPSEGGSESSEGGDLGLSSGEDQGGGAGGGATSPCDHLELATQCPPGSTPTVDRQQTQACERDTLIEGDSGEITAACFHREACTIRCNFADPCPCGIAEISRTTLTCMDCELASACGNARCERGETPASCPIDCSERCTPKQERCNGDDREVCGNTGLWERAACRADQRCDFGGSQEQLRTVCQTRISPPDGTWPGLGDHLVPTEGDSPSIQYPWKVLSCGDPDDCAHGECHCAGYGFLDGQRVLALWRHKTGLQWTDTLGILRFLEPREPGHFEVLPFQEIITQTLLAHNSDLLFYHAAGRWPQLASLTAHWRGQVEAVVHDRAFIRSGTLAVQRDGDLAAAAYMIGYEERAAQPMVALWRTEDSKIERLLRFVDPALPTSAPASALRFSPNGQVLAEGRARSVILWNVAEGRPIALFETGTEVQQIALSDEAAGLMAVSGPQGAELWRVGALSDGQRPQLLWRKPNLNAKAIAIAPDGQSIAIGLLDAAQHEWSTTQIVSAQEGAPLHTLNGGGALDYSPDGRWLMVGTQIFSDQF